MVAGLRHAEDRASYVPFWMRQALDLRSGSSQEFSESGAVESRTLRSAKGTKRNVEADGGTLTVHDRPGTGCTLTISLPRHELNSRGYERAAK